MENILSERIISDLSELTDNDIKHLRDLVTVKNRSTANKRKVGAIIGYSDFDDDYSITTGYNKMFDNLKTSECENNEGETYECVIHAEEEAIIEYLQLKHTIKYFNQEKLALYVTYSPCMNCCKLIAHSGIKKIFYIQKHAVNFDKAPDNQYSPMQFLLEKGISVNRISEELYNFIIAARK